MSQDEEIQDKFQYDQPWNPVSYFEEENEATGGKPTGSAYSPSKLASLFETNRLAVDQDLAMRKRLDSQSNINDSNTNDVLINEDENTDLDSLSQYTLEVDNGIKILDTTPAINRKAIFHDLDRLRHWRESVDNNPNKEVYISDDDIGNTVQESENNMIDLNMDYILNSLPDVTSFDSAITNVNYGKLHDIENQLNINENLFSIGSTNTINTSVTSNISDKKNNVLEEDSELIINKIIIGDTVNGEVSINNISDLNRKNSEIETSNQNTTNIQGSSDVNNEHLNNIDTLKGLDISDELDTLFDDIDEGLELPDVPEHEINFSIQDGGNLEGTDNNTILPYNNEIDNVTSTSINNDINAHNDVLIGNNETEKNECISPATNSSKSPVTTDVDCIDNTSEECDFIVDDIISSNETDSVDAFIDYVENITSSDVNIPDRTDITDLDQENSLCNDSDDNAIENCMDIDLSNTNTDNTECLAIENILDHIENTESSTTLLDDTGTSSELTNKESELNENNYLEDTKNINEQPIPLDVESSIPVDIFELDTENGIDVDAGSSTTINIDTVDSRTSSINSDDTVSSNSSTTCGASLAETKPSDSPIPIPKTVNVSSVLHQDSIGCLTPDDDDDDMMVASTSGYSASRNRSNSTSDNEPCTSIAELEKQDISDDDELNNESSNTAVDVKIVESDVYSVSMSDNDENSIDIACDAVSPDLGDAESIVSNVAEISNIANINSENIDAPSGNLEVELVTADDVDTHSISSNSNLYDESNARLTEISTPEENTIVDAVFDTGNSGISDAVFENPSDSCSINNTQAISEANSSEQIPGGSHSRSSGSIRRVRFSLDNENTEDDQDNTSVASGSFSEQQSTSLLGDDNPSNTELDANAEMRNLGWVAPKWIPDSDAKSCMTCNTKFTVVKRRHHCRACGKVLCSQCCNMKFHMPYMDYKPVRVCQACCDIMITALNGAAQGEQQTQPTEQPSLQTPAAPVNFPLPEAPPPYSETIDGHSERLGSTSSNAPPYSEAATPRFDEQPAEVISAGQAMENLPVMRNFPNAPINDMMSFQLPGYSSNTRPRNSRNRSESEMSAVIMFNSTVTNLPPILRRDNEETRIINNPDLNILLKQMHDENEDPIAYIVNKNLVVRVKVVNMDCCVEKKCWCFVSDGMGASNQEEVVIVIKCNSYDIDEIVLLRKVLQQMNAIFEKAKHGNAVSDSEQMEFNENIRCMAKNTGMLFYKPTLQCVKKLFLPTSPYLFGMYIEKSEVAWAKNFPLRLLLRIGAEFKYYPCPLFNVLDRPAVYDGVGRTILDLLADFRNFQYTLPRIVGVTINLRGKDTIIKLPRHRFDEVLKAVNAAEENVLSLAGNFSPTCDGHLVSVEKDGRYKTQTLSIVLKENRKVTCASFFVMSAALKPDQSGIKAKASIVEDGVMVQVTSEVIQEFKNAIKEMKEYTITAGNPSADDSSQVGIEWCTADAIDRPKLTSPIDATPFDNLTNMKIRHSYDYTSNNLTAKIHWVEVYFLPQDNDTTVQRLSARELGQMTSSIAKACMSALSPHLMTLIALEMTRIGLRVNLAANFVEYKIGANLTTLPPELLPTLDDKLVPAVHNVMSSAQERVAVELIFQLVKIV